MPKPSRGLKSAALCLITSGLDELHLSIDGSDQESYGTYRRGGDFREIIESLRLAQERRVDRFVFQNSAIVLKNSKTYVDGSPRFRGKPWGRYVRLVG
jgi:MoaA/NifB/PqqE/SkfB family radical SAM enzyme